MFVLTFTNPDDAEVTVLYASDSKDNLESLIKEFKTQMGNLPFDECPNEITFGDLCLVKDKVADYMYSSTDETVFIPFDAYFAIHKVITFANDKQ
jgi:hypothetical protein